MIRSCRSYLTLVVFGTVLFPYTASFGDTGGTIAVRNETRHYIHVYLGPTACLYIRPGGAASMRSGEGSVFAHALYAPAQGITGAADSLLTITAHYNQNLDCGGGTCDSSTETETSVSYTSVTWHVTPQVLDGGPQ